MARLRLALLVAAIVVPTMAAAQAPPAARPVNGPAISMYGDLKYPPGFTHFQYANPEALKGGEVKLAAFGTFDTLNPFTLKGVTAAGLGELFDSLMAPARDEAFSYYGLVAETIETPADRSCVAFTLRTQARFQVGTEHFESIRYDYYRDVNLALEALKAGQYELRLENVAKNWATAYTGPAVSQGFLKK